MAEEQAIEKNLSNQPSPELGSIINEILSSRGWIKKSFFTINNSKYSQSGSISLQFNDKAHSQEFIAKASKYAENLKLSKNNTILFESKNYFTLLNIIGPLSDNEARKILILLEQGLQRLENKFTHDKMLDNRHFNPGSYLAQLANILCYNRSKGRSLLDLPNVEGKTLLYRIIENGMLPFVYFFIINYGADPGFGYYDVQHNISAFDLLCTKLIAFKNAFKSSAQFLDFYNQMNQLKKDFYTKKALVLRQKDPLHYLFYKFNFTVSSILNFNLFNNKLFDPRVKNIEFLATFTMFTLFADIDLNGSHLWFKFHELHKEALESKVIKPKNKPSNDRISFFGAAPLDSGPMLNSDEIAVIFATTPLSLHRAPVITTCEESTLLPETGKSDIRAVQLLERLEKIGLSTSLKNGNLIISFTQKDAVAKQSIMHNLKNFDDYVVSKSSTYCTKIIFFPTSFENLDMILIGLYADHNDSAATGKDTIVFN